MKVLIIYGHPYSKSFNHAIKDTLVNSLEQHGHEVRVRDLYALNFDPILKADELAGFVQKNYSEDIQIEHNHIVWAEMLFFISPIWWGGLTSILRGSVIEFLVSILLMKRHLQAREDCSKGKRPILLLRLARQWMSMSR